MIFPFGQRSIESHKRSSIQSGVFSIGEESTRFSSLVTTTDYKRFHFLLNAEKYLRLTRMISRLQMLHVEV